MERNQSVQVTQESCQEVGDTRSQMSPMGTFVTLGATDPTWLAESFKPAITKFFQDWTQVRIQSLTFNGEAIFDYRLWPPPPERTVQIGSCRIPLWMVWRLHEI